MAWGEREIHDQRAARFAEAVRRLEEAAEDCARDIGGAVGERFLTAIREALAALPDPRNFAALSPNLVPRPSPARTVTIDRYEDVVIETLLGGPRLRT